MSNQFLLDEHLYRWWPRAVVRLQPGLAVWRIGDYGAPALGSPDPVLLEWCEARNFQLVSDNRRSMPGHLADHLARGRHVPGIFLVPRTIPVVVLAEQLALIAFASFPGEFRDRITHLPLRS
jgi:hypothetical protein